MLSLHWQLGHRTKGWVEGVVFGSVVPEMIPAVFFDRKIEKRVRPVSAGSVTAIAGMRFEFLANAFSGIRGEWFLLRQFAL